MSPKTEVFGKEALGGYKQSLCIERDKWGGIWVGTPEKVHHFNGEYWESIKLSQGFQMYALHVDQEQRVWAGGKGEFGYLTIDDEQGAKKSTSEKGGSDIGLRYVSLMDKLPDSLKDFNIVWGIKTWGDRVLFNARGQLMILEDGDFHSIEPRGDRFFRSFRFKDELWVQDLGKGLYRLPKDQKLRNEKGRLRESLKVPNSSITGGAYLTALIPPPNGITQPDELLLISFKSGFYRYPLPSSDDEKERGIRKIPLEKEATFKKAGCYHGIGLPPHKSQKESGVQYTLSIASSHKGLFLMNRDLEPQQQLRRGQKLPSNDIWQLARGAPGSGQIWAATEKGTARILSEDPRSWGLENNKVHKIIEHRGRIWVATEHGVLLRRPAKSILSKGEKGRWDTASSGPTKFFDLLSLQDREEGSKKVFAAAGPSGAYLLKAGKKTDISVIDIDAYQISSLSSDIVAIGGREGIVLLEKRGMWEPLLHVYDLPEEPRRMEAHASMDKGMAELWCGFSTKGALHIRLPLDRLRKEIEDSVSFDWDKIRAEHPMAIEGAHYPQEELGKQVGIHPYKGELILSSSKGLWRAKPEEEKEGKDAHRYTIVPEERFHEKAAGGREKGPGVRSFTDLKVGRNGTVWGIPFHGAYRFQPDGQGGYRLDSVPFKQLGIGNVNSVYSDSSGITWFGGTEGLARYNPRIERSYDRDYPASIRRVRVELPEKEQKRKGKKDSLIAAGQYRIPASEKSILSWQRKLQQPNDQTPVLPYSLNALSFEFSAYFFEGRDELRYSYKLEGYEKEWSPWQKANDKAYTNLWEGTYRFKVKAKNIYGKESKVAVFRFRILPPWYRTHVAYAGYGILAVLLIWGVAKAAARRAELHRKRLERIVDERTQEIQEKNQALTEEKARVEEAHKEITDSIDYAQKIQYALLQSEEYVSPHLPEHFILFKPQAKVSGDFYWAREQMGFLYVAAVDCTGHGVPGAFMSMLGISQLNEIMAAHDDPTPGEVLTELRKRVVEELSSGNREEGAKDGMDAALVKIPLQDPGSQTPNSRSIEFAGANNPLYVVKKGIAEATEDLSGLESSDRISPFKKTPDGFEVKGDKMAVGYEPDAAEAFTTVELEVSSGAMLYLFSDGYADQFGGPKGKKFRYGPFKELLARVHTLPPEEQKAELDRVFEEWKENQEQIDDVCVIGIRIEG